MAGIPMWESQLRPQTLPARVGFPPTFHIQTGTHPSQLTHRIAINGTSCRESPLSYTLPGNPTLAGNPNCPIPHLGIPTVLYLAWESHFSWESQLSYTSPGNPTLAGNPNCPIPCLGIPLQLGIPTVLYLTWESHLNWESQLSYTLPGNPTSAGNPNL
ncbi:hypothetical protein DFH05DRAFT_1462624 [Lentinula detonsa]|uniref:Uncharacterized protein n=1 Tax=Lentinula detonsa TaxID=2804962 RepID=A0A9W8NVQ5_9AGAR|nr:hypothetical protein DFH05DRAFT_1462624 [Lentinula detonsa]